MSADANHRQSISRSGPLIAMRCRECGTIYSPPCEHMRYPHVDLGEALEVVPRAAAETLVGALAATVESWNNPAPAARQDVRYQEAVRRSREAVDAFRARYPGTA